MISESQKEKIRQEAKEILGKFAKSLEKVPEIKSKPQPGSSHRKEGPGKSSSPDFKKRIFANAPHKNQDFIIAERAKWE